jgi:hypothetical protein
MNSYVSEMLEIGIHMLGIHMLEIHMLGLEMLEIEKLLEIGFS